MSEEHVRYLTRWLAHVRVLAEDIGPRGSTTEEERRASEYCAQVMRALGLSPRIESFESARSIYHPHLLAAAIILAAFAVYPLFGRVSAMVASLLTLGALVADLMELTFRDNLLRRLVPKGPSQNVFATIPPAKEHRRDLVLIGHVDSHRTSVVFSTSRWVATYQAFTTVAFAFFLAQVVLYGLGAYFQWSWIWLASIPSAVCALLLAAMCVQADLTPFSAGANDNATGAGLILALAEQLREVPLRHTRVWLVCTGCEEVQHYGANDFFRRHKAEFHEPAAVAFEVLGCAGPAWLTKEGIVIPFRCDKRLVALAEELAARNSEWGAYPAQIKGGNTEMADALRVGIPAITILGIGPKGEIPYWHQVGDTFDKLDEGIMGRAYAFIWTFVKALDALPVST